MVRWLNEIAVVRVADAQLEMSENIETFAFHNESSDARSLANRSGWINSSEMK